MSMIAESPPESMDATALPTEVPSTIAPSSVSAMPDRSAFSTSWGASTTAAVETASSAPSMRQTSWDRNTIIEVSAAVGGTIILAVATLILIYWMRARRRKNPIGSDNTEKPSNASNSSSSLRFPPANENYLAICRLLDEALESRDSLVTPRSSTLTFPGDGSTPSKESAGQSPTSETQHASNGCVQSMQ